MFQCPCCGKMTKEILYRDRGYVSFPLITNEHDSVRSFACPNCAEEIEYNDLIEAGAKE